MAESMDKIPTFISEYIVTPMHFYSYGGGGSTHIDNMYHASLQLVVTGRIEDGFLNTSNLTAKRGAMRLWLNSLFSCQCSCSD
jgi:hypothetical protein